MPNSMQESDSIGNAQAASSEEQFRQNRKIPDVDVSVCKNARPIQRRYSRLVSSIKQSVWPSSICCRLSVADTHKVWMRAVISTQCEASAKLPTLKFDQICKSYIAKAANIDGERLLFEHNMKALL